IIASLNIFVGAFNLLPLLPLDGGHLAIVIFERARAWLARLMGRPDPGPVDYRRLVPLSVGVFALLVGVGLLLIMADLVNPVHLEWGTEHMPTDLGMPGLPVQPVAERRKSRQVMVGKGKHAVPVGGGAAVSVQSMTTTLTADVNATLQQIAELTATGCQIV